MYNDSGMTFPNAVRMMRKGIALVGCGSTLRDGQRQRTSGSVRTRVTSPLTYLGRQSAVLAWTYHIQHDTQHGAIPQSDSSS